MADRSRVALAVVLALALLALARPSEAAATWVVTKTADTNDGTCDTDCSVREALAAATTDDTVTIPSGTFELDAPGSAH